MMMSGPALVSIADAIRGLRSFMLIRSTVTSTPASLPHSAASRLNSTSEAGTKLTHSRMLSLVPFGKLEGLLGRYDRRDAAGHRRGARRRARYSEKSPPVDLSRAPEASHETLLSRHE